MQISYQVLEYVVYGYFLAMLFVVFVWVWRARLRTVFEARFYRRLSKTDYVYNEVGKKEFARDAEEIRYKKRTFLVDLKDIAFTDRRKTIVCYDFDTEKVLKFGEFRTLTSTKLADVCLKYNVLQKLYEAFTDISKLMWILIFVFIALSVVCFVAGYGMAGGL